VRAISLPARIVLGLCFAVCLAGGALNHQALLNSDSYSYLSFARALARGSLYQEYDLYRLFADRVPPGRTINLHYGTRNYRDGLVYSGLPIGFPLLLALAIRLFGLPAVFAVNVAMLALFLGAYFLAVREMLRDDPGRDGLALVCVALVLILDQRIIYRFSLMLMRDLSSLAFLWVGLACLLSAVRVRPVSAGMLFAAVLALGASCTIRITNGIAFLPLLAYAAVASRGGLGGLRRAALLALSGTALFALMYSPEMIENFQFNRNPFAPFLHALMRSPSTGESLFSWRYFARHLPSNLLQLDAVLGPGGLALALFGVVVLRRRLVLWLILLAIPLLHFLFFSFFEQDYRRYLMPLYPFLAVLLAVGAISALRAISAAASPRRWARLLAGLLGLALGACYFRLRSGPTGLGWMGALVPLAAVWLALLAWPFPRPSPARFQIAAPAALLVVLAEMLVWISRAGHFGWADVVAFRERIEREVPAGSVVFGTRYLVQNIDAYTHARSIDPIQLSGPFDLSLADAAGRIIRAGRPLFIVDNKGVKSSSRYLRELGRSFDLEETKRWRSEDLKLNLRGYSENDHLALYRVLPWSETQVETTLDTPERTDYLVLIDLKELDPSAAGSVRAWVGEVPLDARLQPGLNYIHLPAAAVAVPATRLRLNSPSPVTGRGYLGISPVRAGLVLSAGKGKGVPDALFLEEGFRSARSNAYRLLRSEGSIRIPVVRIPGHRPVVKLMVRNKSASEAPLLLRLSLDGSGTAEFRLPARTGWQTVTFPLPDGALSSPAAALAISIALRDGEAAGPALALKEIRLEQVPENAVP